MSNVGSDKDDVSEDRPPVSPGDEGLPQAGTNDQHEATPSSATGVADSTRQPDVDNPAEGTGSTRSGQGLAAEISQGFEDTAEIGEVSDAHGSSREAIAGSRSRRSFKIGSFIFDEDDDSESGAGETSSVDLLDGSAAYNEKDLISRPKLSENCSVPENILEFQFSFGYDCQLHSNLCVLDSDTLAFISGNLIHFYKISERKAWFRRSAGGDGLGHLAKNPVQPHLAVGERGLRPKIIVYEWPSLRVVALLRGGTERVYTYLNYSVDGELLCSAGGPPDNFFTLWNWRESRIMLRAKSSGQDVFHAAFSSYMPGHITSAGSAHVRFWRMAQTFTGLKLQGAPGRFGNTEVSDVIGVLAMPDGKVVSGCEWGNILIWEAGLIKAEVTKKGRKSCHSLPIAQFEYFNGELVSVGMDGFVKVWYFETIDLADPPDDDRFVEVEPIFELEVADELGPASLMCMQRQPDAGEHAWLAQDAGGGMWRLDLSLAVESPPPHRLLTSHAGEVAGLATAPHGPFLATLGREGRLHVYNGQLRGLLVARTFPAAGHALLWLPKQAASSCSALVLACADGALRLVAVDLAAAERQYPQHSGTALGTADLVTLLQVLKAHSQATTALALSDDGGVLASGGEDRVVFLFRVEPRAEFATMVPLGFVQLDEGITYLTFKSGSTSTLLAGCSHGQVTEVSIPESSAPDTSVSYMYPESASRKIVYKNVKGRLRREKNLREAQKRKRKKMRRKWEKLEAMRADNPALEIDEEAFLADSEEEEEPEQLNGLGELCAVRWVRYLDDDTVWLSVAGADAGYLYTYRFGQEEPLQCTAVPGNDDLEVSSFLFYPQSKHLFLGMGDGAVRCVHPKPGADATSDLSDYWSLGMHNSTVTGLALSADLRTLYSTGADGNVFMFSVHPEGGDPPVTASSSAAPPPVAAVAAAEELYGGEVPTLEEQCAKAEQDRKARLAADKLQRMQQVLWGLAVTYNNIIKRNRQLPASQQVPASELELDPRITPSTRLALEAEADLLRRKLAFPLERATLQYRKLADFYTDAVVGHGIRVYAVRKDAFVETIRQRKLTEEFDAACALVQLKQEEAQRRGRTVEREVTQLQEDDEIVLAPAPVESFLRGVSAFEHKFSTRLRRLLDKYHSRKYKRERRQAEWAQFMRKKPDMTKTDPADEELIQEAEKTIGDYKLKSDDDYNVPADQVITTVNKYQQLLQVRKQLDELLGSFNAEVLALRQRKADLRERMVGPGGQEDQLRRLHAELPPELHLQPPTPPTMDLATEYPERQFQITEEEIEAEMNRTAPSRRLSRPGKVVPDVPPPPEDPELEVLQSPKDRVLEMGECESLDKLVETLVESDVGELQRVDSEVEMSELRALGQDDAEDTAWEKEQRAARLIRKVWEQRELVGAMERQVDAVDEAVEELAARRLVVQRDATLLRHHLLVLHQELVIIKECEEREETLAAKVADKEFDYREAQLEALTIQNKLDAKGRDIVRCQEKEKELQLAFLESIGDNHYADFLKKVFKKKYRPPKATDAGSSEDTSSSSSSDEGEEDEGSSLLSNELGSIRYDGTTCPPGCSEEMFQLTLRMRDQRHDTEREAAEHRRDVDHLLKEQEAASKRLRKVQDLLRQDEGALQAFRRDKQQRLNEVETIVVLRLSQLQHMRPDGKFEQLRNTLVFNTAVLADLDRRKQQLDEEARAQHAKHKKNRTHLHRMVLDVRFMKNRLKSLREQIEEAQYRKFGCIVDLTELEQALLKRFIWDLRSSADEIRAEFRGLIKSIQADVRNKFEELKRTIEQNTVRQNLLIVLVEERNRLLSVVSRNEKTKALEPVEDDDDGRSPFAEDIEQLQVLVRQLQARRDALLAEVVKLRQKGPLPPLPRPALAAVTAPGPSAYHGGCGAEQIPPPQAPWPPSCVTALKHPMYLGESRTPGLPFATGPAATPSTSRSLAARREAVREQLEAGAEAAEVRHPQPLQRLGRSLSLDSLAGQPRGPGFLSADMRNIPPIPSEEELAAGTAPSRTPSGRHSSPVQDDDGDDGAIDSSPVEEIFRRVSSRTAEDAVDGFLERLGSQDGGEAMMRVTHDRSSVSDGDVDPVSDPEPVFESELESESEADDGIEVLKEPTPRRRDDGTTDEDDRP